MGACNTAHIFNGKIHVVATMHRASDPTMILSGCQLWVPDDIVLVSDVKPMERSEFKALIQQINVHVTVQAHEADGGTFNLVFLSKRKDNDF